MLQGRPGRVAALNEGNEFLVLQHVNIEKRGSQKQSPSAAGIMLLVIALAIFSNLGIATSMVIGSVLMVLTGCLTMDEAYDSIDWRTVFLVGGMLTLGIAMENTGTAQFLSNLLLGMIGDLGPTAMLAAVLTALRPDYPADVQTLLPLS